MILTVALLPQLHGQIGWLDELELCLAPFVIVITVLVYRFLSQRAARRPARTRQRRRAPDTEKK